VRLSLLPREEKFFDYFQKGSSNLVAVATALSDLLADYRDVERKIEYITELEHRGDALTHQIMEQLHRTFITPLDREDIALLAHTLDDVTDFIESAADTMLVYNIKQPTSRACQMSSTIVKAAIEVDKSLTLLRNPTQLKRILHHCIEINRLENEGDEIFRLALAELFADSMSITDVIKWREIYEQIENAMDKCEDIANVLEGVVLKNA